MKCEHITKYIEKVDGKKDIKPNFQDGTYMGYSYMPVSYIIIWCADCGEELNRVETKITKCLN